MLTTQGFLEVIWSYLQSKDLKWCIIPPQQSNPLVFFQELTKEQEFKGLSIQICSDGSWSVFKDQYGVALPELVPERLQSITDAMDLMRAVETSQICPGITDEKYRNLIGRSILQHATVQENPFLIRPFKCNWLMKVILGTAYLKLEGITDAL
jgi:hypothetical protein